MRAARRSYLSQLSSLRPNALRRQSVILAAESRGLQFEMIRTAKGKSRKTNFRTFHQRRIIIEANLCAIYSASEVTGIKAKGYRVVVVKAPA
jgi:hypothetical protein